MHSRPLLAHALFFGTRQSHTGAVLAGIAQDHTLVIATNNQRVIGRDKLIAGQRQPVLELLWGAPAASTRR